MEKNGGAAFPGLPIDYVGADGVKRSVDGGMTLRDYFAGQAMMGIFYINNGRCPTVEAVTKLAYEYAAAMLSEKARREPSE